MIDHSPFKRGDQTLVKLDTHAETERTRRLQAGEKQRLLQHASPHLRALIVAALETGCRLGELLSLQWEQIQINDKGQQEILLPASKTKTHEPRIIPVSLVLRAELEMRRTDPKGVALPPAAFVFGNEVGQRVGSVKTAWRNTCRRAGISELHFHDLRREFACGLLEGRRGRADLSVVREFLGHANITTTSRYLKTTTTRMREALEQREVSPEPSGDVAESPHATELH
jgi:integrase